MFSTMWLCILMDEVLADIVETHCYVLISSWTELIQDVSATEAVIT